MIHVQVGQQDVDSLYVEGQAQPEVADACPRIEHDDRAASSFHRDAGGVAAITDRIRSWRG